MRHTGVDERYELVLGLKLSVKDIACHVYDLKELHMLVAFVIFLHFKLDVLTLGLTNVFTVLLVILRGSRLHVYILHLKDCAG